MPVLTNTLGQQQPQQQAPVAPPPPDPIDLLMAEYDRLEQKATPKAMFTPEQVQQRQQQNNDLTELGVIGSMVQDRGISGVGGQIFKNALAARQPKITERGEYNPLTGEETLSPGFQTQQAEARRGSILQRVAALTSQREARAQALQIANDNRASREAIAAAIQEGKNARAGAGGGMGDGKNMSLITDPITGQQFWANPRTGQTVSPVMGLGGAPLVKPDKMTSADEKASSDLVRTRAATESALKAVESAPDAFGMMKGIPNLGTGTTSLIAQAARDATMSPDQLAARAAVYNIVSAAIKERAGTAQSAGELKRLNSFLPGDLDKAPQITAKLKAFNEYLAEQEEAIKSRYRGPRPVQHTGNTGTGPKRLKFNPATGKLE